MKWLLLALLVAGRSTWCASLQAGLAAASATRADELISFLFKPNAEAEPSWSLTSFGDGSGVYNERHGEIWTKTSITVSERVRKLLAKSMPAVAQQKCETKSKNIAKTGGKTITFRVGPSSLSCSFNYSDDVAVMEAARSFQSIAETMRMGDKLAHDKRFDHLGLNADLEQLTKEAKAGDAIELQNIATVLQSISDNDELMDVVRRKAQSLLQDSTINPGK